jgi:uncharacterized protein (DUF3820 family)
MPSIQQALQDFNRPRMPFGAHKGQPLDELPDDYLLWLSLLSDLRQPLLGHVLREMGRRLAARPPATESSNPHDASSMASGGAE